jgi:hypothetical protein
MYSARCAAVFVLVVTVFLDIALASSCPTSVTTFSQLAGIDCGALSGSLSITLSGTPPSEPIVVGTLSAISGRLVISYTSTSSVPLELSFPNLESVSVNTANALIFDYYYYYYYYYYYDLLLLLLLLLLESLRCCFYDTCETSPLFMYSWCALQVGSDVSVTLNGKVGYLRFDSLRTVATDVVVLAYAQVDEVSLLNATTSTQSLTIGGQLYAYTWGPSTGNISLFQVGRLGLAKKIDIYAAYGSINQAVIKGAGATVSTTINVHSYYGNVGTSHTVHDICLQ